MQNLFGLIRLKQPFSQRLNSQKIMFNDTFQSRLKFGVGISLEEIIRPDQPLRSQGRVQRALEIERHMSVQRLQVEADRDTRPHIGFTLRQQHPPRNARFVGVILLDQIHTETMPTERQRVIFFQASILPREGIAPKGFCSNSRRVYNRAASSVESGLRR